MDTQTLVEAVKNEARRDFRIETSNQTGHSVEEWTENMEDQHFYITLGYFMLGLVAASTLVEHGPLDIDKTIELGKKYGSTDPVQSIPEVLEVSPFELMDGLNQSMSQLSETERLMIIPDVMMGLVVGRALTTEYVNTDDSW